MRENVKKLTLRLTALEYAHLKKLSELSGLKLEPLLRKLVMGVQLRPRPPDTYAQLLRQLSGIGTNLNQIAHIANSRQDISQDSLEEAVRLARKAWEAVKRSL